MVCIRSQVNNIIDRFIKFKWKLNESNKEVKSQLAFTSVGELILALIILASPSSPVNTSGETTEALNP